MAQGFTQGLSHPPPPTLLPTTHHRRQQIPAAPPFSRHNSSAHSATTYPTIPIIPQEKTHQFDVYEYTRTHMLACTYMCACANICACVGGFATAPPIRHGPEGPSRIRYIYIVYVLYSCCCWVPYSQRTPLHPTHSVIPNTNTFTPPSVHQCRQSSTGSGSTTVGTRVVVVLLIPPPSPITVSSLTSSTLYCCRRQRPTSPTPYLQILLYPLVFRRNLTSTSRSK